MVEESVAYLKKYVPEVFFIGEHFFDGYKNNKDTSLNTIGFFNNKYEP